MTYAQTKWTLADLFSGFGSPDLEAAFDQIEEQVKSFEGIRSRLKPELESGLFLEFMHASEALSRILSKLNSFSGLSFEADTQDQTTQALVARVEQFRAEIGNRMLFFSLWWKDLDEKNAARLMDGAGDYRYFLEEMRHFKPHTLTEPEERVVNLKNVTGVSALNTLYDSLVNRYVFKLEVDGQMREMTASELMSYRYSTDPDVRAGSYKEQFRVYNADGPILAQIYQAIVRDWHNENLALRKFSSPLSARNLFNDIPDEAVSALLEVSRKNAVIFQRYFKLKAKLLGMNKLRRYDIYAPVTKSVKPFEFGAAAETVLEVFTRFDPSFASHARRVFDQDHLDSEIRKGKDGGAFCWSVLPEMTPYVLLNYQGRARDVAVMAHELGHAIHSMLSAKHSLFTFHSSLPLAETASTFCEMLLTDTLLAAETDPAVRRDLLFKQMDDAYATIMRQAFLAMFEVKAHDLIQHNASPDELCRAYFDNLKEQFGDALELSDEFQWEWVSIPHIHHTPFYVYAYAFGQLLVLALYQQFKAEGSAFKPKYIKILSAGGSEAPARILSEAGIDIRSAKFWQGGFDILDRLEKDLENL